MVRLLSNSVLKQLCVLGIVFIVVFGVLWVGDCCYYAFKGVDVKGTVWRTLELMMDPGVYATQPTIEFDGNISDNIVELQTKVFPVRSRLLELVISLFGAVLFTGMLISIISNAIGNFVSSFKSGLMRFRFSDHILVLGANDMLANMIRSFANPKSTATCDKFIVILTNRNVEELYSKLYSELTKEEMRNLVLLLGNRDSSEELKSVHLGKASMVYIIGEDDEPMHDSVNISCLEKVESICSNKTAHVQDCVLVINNMTSYHVFNFRTTSDEERWINKLKETEKREIKVYKKSGVSEFLARQNSKELPASSLSGSSPNKFHLTVINTLENWAQQVLVSGRYEDIDNYIVYPKIDGEAGIGPDSDRRVHFVVVGMTQMSLAMATTVAHIAHYPNFKKVDSDGKNKYIRTKITFIAENILQDMNFFKGHYSSLFKLCHSTLVTFDADGVPVRQCTSPEERYGDFLDIEWQFIDGGIESEPVRKLLSSWARGEGDAANDIMTMAICNNDTLSNAASSLYLPDEIYSKQIPVLVYQPLRGKVMELALKTKRYGNVYPFGMMHHCYDRSLKSRLRMARRINYVYQNVKPGVPNISIPTDPGTLENLWDNLSFAERLSNIYSANSIPTKMRSVFGESEPSELSEDQVKILARVEHSRWNVEKLLIGFHAMPEAERKALNDKAAADDARIKEQYKNEKRMNKGNYLHPDIAPYSELPDDSKKYDMEIVRYLKDVVEVV